MTWWQFECVLFELNTGSLHRTQKSRPYPTFTEFVEVLTSLSGAASKDAQFLHDPKTYGYITADDTTSYALSTCRCIHDSPCLHSCSLR